MASFAPEDPCVPSGDERQIEAQVDVGARAEHELALVDLDLGLAVDGDEELLRGRLALLAFLRQRRRMERHSRRDRGGISRQGALDHLARNEAGPLGEATDQLEFLHAERDGPLRRSLACLSRRCLAGHAAASIPRRAAGGVQPREKSRRPNCRSPKTTTETSSPSKSSMPTTCTTDSIR